MTDWPADTMPLIPPPEFQDHLVKLKIQLEPGDEERLGLYLALLLQTNRQFNLTGITDPGEAWIRHIVDSLALLPVIASIGASDVIDIGSGGGMPGLPLAIVLPNVRFTLVEATGKKAAFLRAAAGRLDLGNVRVLNERAETLGRDLHEHRERYDLALARALGKLPVLLELTIPFVKIDGFVLAIKGEKAQDEIAGAKAALHKLHSEVTSVERGATGTIISIQKRRKTPKLYPRKPGEPKRAPLGVMRET